jgi:hypothetical protein
MVKMSTHTTPHRRIVKRAVIALAVVVLVGVAVWSLRRPSREWDGFPQYPRPEQIDYRQTERERDNVEKVRAELGRKLDEELHRRDAARVPTPDSAP